MNQLISTLTKKYQTTIPKSVREALHLHSGDKIMFVMDKKSHVVLKKATPLDVAYTSSLEGTLEEWNSAIDDNAYADLYSI